MSEAKKPYQPPQCRRLGTVQELTQNASLQNADAPTGSNTAFSGLPH
jgi:hypothetical protein